MVCSLQRFLLDVALSTTMCKVDCCDSHVAVEQKIGAGLGSNNDPMAEAWGTHFLLLHDQLRDHSYLSEARGPVLRELSV